MAYIKIKHEDITHDLDTDGYINVLGSTVTYSGKKNIGAEPAINGNSIVEVQTQSYDNPRIVISNIKLHDITYFNIVDIQKLYKAKYSGTNPVVVKIAYGGDDINVSGLLTDTILAVMDSFTINIDARNSEHAYMPLASVTFIETK